LPDLKGITRHVKLDWACEIAQKETAPTDSVVGRFSCAHRRRDPGGGVRSAESAQGSNAQLIVGRRLIAIVGSRHTLAYDNHDDRGDSSGISSDHDDDGHDDHDDHDDQAGLELGPGIVTRSSVTSIEAVAQEISPADVRRATHQTITTGAPLDSDHRRLRTVVGLDTQ
jgi:hypothetical protein